MLRDRTTNWADVVALTTALLILTFGIGRYGLFEPHEGHFAGVAREMVLRGDWITPHLNGSNYLNKPPLMYWLIATSYQIFGINEFAARLPAALAGWLGVVVAWKWARDLWGPVASRVVAIMLGVTVGWFIFAHQILIDELLATLLLGMVYCLWRLIWQPQSRFYFLGTYLLLGLTLMAKGLLGGVFFVAACGAIALSRRSLKVIWQLRPLQGLGLVLAVVLPWYIAAELANPGFLQYLIVNEHLKRVFNTRWPPDYTVSTISPWGYLLVSAVWCLPWALLLPPAIAATWQDWRQGQRSDATPAARRRSEGLLLLSITAAVPLLLFLPMSSRLYYYSLPAVPPLILLGAGWWRRLITPAAQPTRQRLGIGLSVVGLGIVIAGFWTPPAIVRSFPELVNTPGATDLVMAMLLGLGFGLVLGGGLLLAKRPVLALMGLWLGLATVLAGVAHGFSLVQDVRSSKDLVQTAEVRLGPNTLWTFEGSRELGAAGAMSFYLDREGQPLSAIPGFTPNQDLPTGWVAGKPGTAYRVVLVLTDGGPNRLPPEFPGGPPSHWITQPQLQVAWQSDRPVVFVTDFLRIPGDPNDPPDRNLPPDAGAPLLQLPPRQLYGNAAARKRWAESGITQSSKLSVVD